MSNKRQKEVQSKRMPPLLSIESDRESDGESENMEVTGYAILCDYDKD